ncbi:MAG: chondroitinase-B domain-containing protein [Bacteroidota bacterium]
MRIGVSTQSEFNSRTIVEYCYFTNCDGDGELISYKASQNVIRYNTFENNTKAEVVLRHGNDAIVYGNFFLNNMGGVRVREGQNHFIYNNYFEGLERRSIFLQNEASDPLNFIHVYFNTIVDSEEMRLGGDGDSNPPQNVVIANNIFANPKDDLFRNATGEETWINNISLGSLGISTTSGITPVDPLLQENSEGFLQLSSSSPAIDGAGSEYPSVPTFDNLDFDNEILLDLMRQPRPQADAAKDIGASEFSEEVLVQPIANESNTGPEYLSDQSFARLTTSVEGDGIISIDPISDTYAIGSTVTLTALPTSNTSRFISWSGALSSSENPLTVVLNQDTEIAALFEESPLGLEDESAFKIFPNPVNEKVNLTFQPQETTEFSIEIYSTTGKLIKQISKQKIKNGTNNISYDMSNYGTGIYIVQLKTYDTLNNLIDVETIKPSF